VIFASDLLGPMHFLSFSDIAVDLCDPQAGLAGGQAGIFSGELIPERGRLH
jgi:hypothetical protein